MSTITLPTMSDKSMNSAAFVYVYGFLNVLCCLSNGLGVLATASGFPPDILSTYLKSMNNEDHYIEHVFETYHMSADAKHKS